MKPAAPPRERLFELPRRGGHVLFRWVESSVGMRGSLWFDGRRFDVSYRVERVHNGERSVEEAEHLAEFNCRGLVHDLPDGPILLAPKRTAKGFAQLSQMFDPASFQTEHWVLEVGHSASGTIYNSSICSRRKARLELDLEQLIARYFEEDHLDDS